MGFGAHWLTRRRKIFYVAVQGESLLGERSNERDGLELLKDLLPVRFAGMSARL